MDGRHRQLKKAKNKELVIKHLYISKNFGDAPNYSVACNVR
jgi:hypothetical protein